MAEFLTTVDISSKITQIIRKADQHIGIVSPYLQLSDKIKRRLRDACRDGKEVLIIYGKDDLRGDVEAFIAELGSVHLFYNEDLHAKCYFNEHEIVITSMNLYEYSERNNREMGIAASADEDIYKEAVEEVRSIRNDAERQTLAVSKQGTTPSLSQLFELGGDGNSHAGTEATPLAKAGVCIRCRAEIDHDPGRPYCRDCFSVWARYQDEEYPENHCHTCGTPHQTTMSRPQCKGCWRKTRYALSSRAESEGLSYLRKQKP